ncbi:glycoside hydrolase family 19 protein [Pseudochelatococcus sp. B33]
MALDHDTFFAEIKRSLFGSFNQDQVDGLNVLLETIRGWPIAYGAYALATAYHETATTMQPIKERGGRDYYMRLYDVTGQNPARARSMGNTRPGDGALYCGRGYVQLTWKVNYEKASHVTGVDLVAEPDRAMEPDIAAQVLRSGMEEGWFTGKGLADYLSGGRRDYVNARRIINGTDKAEAIAVYARKFEAALRQAVS